MMLQITLSYKDWDCPSNSGKYKQLNLESKAFEDIERAYYNINKAFFTAFMVL
jgi:hypothetical protein